MKSRAALLCWLTWGAAAAALPAPAATAGQHPRSVLESVPGLEKPVTYTETKIPLGELVQKVAQETGVALTAAPDVWDEPVAVVVKEFPARELLEELADLLDYQWRQRSGVQAFRRSGVQDRSDASTSRHADSGNPERLNARTPERLNAPSYEIWQDVASKQREEALRRAVLTGVERSFREEVALLSDVASLSQEQIQQILDAAGKRRQELMKLTPEEQDEARSSPAERQQARRANAAWRLSSPAPRALASLLGRLSEPQWALLHGTQQITFSTHPQAGELPLRSEIARVFQSSRPALYPPGVEVDFGDPAEEELVRQYDTELQRQWAAATGFRVTIRLDTTGFPSGGSLFMHAQAMPIAGGGSGQPGAPVFPGAAMGPSLFVSVPPIDFRQVMAEETQGRRAALAKDPVVGVKKVFKPAVSPRNDSDGSARESTWQRWELLPDLARTYGVHFIADAYWTSPPNLSIQPVPSEPIALFTLLDRLWRAYYRWDRRGPLIRLRSRTWFLDRPREIPLRLVRRWQQLIAVLGALPFDECVQIATTLTDGELETLDCLVEQAGFPRGFGEVSSARRALRLYGALSPRQRQALWQGRAIPVVQMTPMQRALFAAALEERHRSRTPRRSVMSAAIGSLSLTSEPCVRVRQQSLNSFSVLRVWLEFADGMEAREAFALTVAPPS